MPVGFAKMKRDDPLDRLFFLYEINWSTQVPQRRQHLRVSS